MSALKFHPNVRRRIGPTETDVQNDGIFWIHPSPIHPQANSDYLHNALVKKLGNDSGPVFN